MKHNIWIWATLSALLIVVGCRDSFHIQFPAETAKDAALQAFNSDARRRKATIDWNTVEILQEQPVNENVVFVLLSFQEFPQTGQPLSCLYYYGIKRSNQRWGVQGSGGGCGAAGQLPPDGSPFQVAQGGGWSRDVEGLTFSSAESFVFDNRIKRVAITWDDDVKQHVDVINQTYLAVRLDVRQVKRIEALDSGGDIIYTSILR